MTLEEILKAKGLDDEAIKATIGEMKQNKIFTASEENLDTRYAKLKGDHDSVNKQLTDANALIEQLKKGTGDNEALQGKIKEYETHVAELEAENLKLKTEGALKVALLDAGAKAADIDYLMFKAGQKGEVKLNEDGTISGQAELIKDLKTSCPSQFQTSDTKTVEEHKLEGGDPNGGNGNNEPKTLAEALKQRYEETNKES